jgi:hypothetical protein
VKETIKQKGFTGNANSNKKVRAWLTEKRDEALVQDYVAETGGAAGDELWEAWKQDEEDQDRLVEEAFELAGDFGEGWRIDSGPLHRSGRVSLAKKLGDLLHWLENEEEGAGPVKFRADHGGFHTYPIDERLRTMLRNNIDEGNQNLDISNGGQYYASFAAGEKTWD